MSQQSNFTIHTELGRLALGLLGLALLASPPRAADPPKPLTADAVRGLQAKFKEERAAAETNGLTKKFSPEWYQRADDLAKRAEEALAANRLVEAHDFFRKARWNLPALPANLPEHVARVF